MNVVPHDLDAVLVDLRAAVVAEARRRRRVPPRVVVALAALPLLVGSGAALALRTDLLAQQETFHAERSDQPRRLSALVEVVSGENWALIAWQSEVGLCLDFAVPGTSPYGCGFPVRGAKPAGDRSGAGPPIHAVAGFVSGGNLVGGDGRTSIFGVAAADVAAVEIELGDGRVVNAPLYDAPAELRAGVRFFIVRLPLPPTGLAEQETVRAYRAYDGEGRLIERFED